MRFSFVFALVAGCVLAAPMTIAAQADRLGDAPGPVLSTTDHAWLADHGPVRIGIPLVEWPPFDMFSSKQSTASIVGYEGITADYLALLGGRLGIDFDRVGFTSFDATLDALQDGSIDVMGSMARTPDREAFAVFTLPYVRSQPVIITRKDDGSIHGLQDLDGKTVAIEKGFASREYLKGLPDIKFLEFTGSKDALEAVSLGQANAYVGSLISSTYIIDREAMSDLEVRTAAGLPISEIRFAVKKSLPDLARILDFGIASITDEEHAAIRKKWIGVAGLGVDWGAILRVATPVGGALLSIILVILIWNNRLHRQVARRRQAEAALATQMNFQMALLENLPALVAYKDCEARFLGCNRAYEEAFGLRREQIIGKTTIDIAGFPNEQRVRGHEQDMEVLRTGDPLHREEQLLFADGTVHDILLWRIPFNLADGIPAGLVSITVDVSKQKGAERALADQLAYQRALMETIPNPICIKDHEARYVGCNHAFEETFGLRREAVIGKTIPEVFLGHPELSDRLHQKNLELLRDKGRYFAEYKFPFADGEHDVLYWVRSFELADGRPGGLVGAFVDVTETKALERQANEAERRLRDITNSVPGVVYQLRVAPSGERSYTFMSDGLKELRGIERDDAMRDYSLVFSQVLDEDRPELDAVIQHAVAARTPMQHEFRVRLPDGTIKWLQSAAEPGGGPDDAVFLNGYWIDITQHREMELALDEAREAADAANRAKSSFLAAMSHEIRTPMNGVLGMLELLSLSQLDGEQRGRLEVARESSRSLVRIINDILDFSKIEAGKLDLRPEPASIADIVHGVREIYSGAASGKNLRLNASVDPRIAPAVMVDPLRLRQILNNFVSNAIKFTAAGAVDIKAERVDHRPDCDTVRFSVIDTGIGISAENQKKLFQPFVQAEADTVRRFGGTGLGLSISRRLAELMGGTIDMESGAGMGTAVSLTLQLPVADPSQIRTNEESSTVSPAHLAARRPPPTIEEAEKDRTLVLVADDHSTNRLMIKSQINLLGYAVELTVNGREALEKWQTGNFALVITDCHMPEMDGYELARTIRMIERRDHLGRTPIIACTGVALEGEAENCLAAGMDDYLAKPIELHNLIGALDRWLPLPDGSLRNGDLAVGAAPAPAVSDGGDDEPIDRHKLSEGSVRGAAVEREILNDFWDATVDDIRELTAALDRGDCVEITRVSHHVKGASLMVGATALAGVCARMESAGRADDHTEITANREPLFREFERLRDFMARL
jgi:PAS domain S-box-containing protein